MPPPRVHAQAEAYTPTRIRIEDKAKARRLCRAAESEPRAWDVFHLGQWGADLEGQAMLAGPCLERFPSASPPRLVARLERAGNQPTCIDPELEHTDARGAGHARELELVVPDPSSVGFGELKTIVPLANHEAALAMNGSEIRAPLRRRTQLV
jgi:hypothetical protein